MTSLIRKRQAGGAVKLLKSHFYNEAVERFRLDKGRYQFHSDVVR